MVEKHLMDCVGISMLFNRSLLRRNMETIEIWFDGSCQPINPGGVGRAASVIKKDGVEIKTLSRVVGSGKGMTNNVAEYHGLKDALLFLKGDGCFKEKIQVFGDSMMVIEQMSDRWKIKTGAYKAVALETKKLVAEFKDIKFSWIPREENGIADRLASGSTN